MTTTEPDRGHDDAGGPDGAADVDDLRLRLLGPTRVRVHGRWVAPAPITAAVLARLVVAAGGPVTVDELFRDVWGDPGGPVRRGDRISVQKRILELRRLLDPGHDGQTSRLLLTERGRVSAYRLSLRPEQADLLEVADLVEGALCTDPATAVGLLTRALELWGAGRPLFDVADRAFAREPIRRLTALHEQARRELMRGYGAIGQHRQALDIGDTLVRDFPDDAALGRTVAELRHRLRAQAGGVLRRDFLEPRISIVVTVGDLFEQHDAHLAIGFSDTFDTSTEHDRVISAESVQGQLTRALYAGDRAPLDRELRAALRDVPPALVEKRGAKRHGKLTRYPIGTVATLRSGARRIFAVAYSRMGNDLVARSSLAELRLGLDRLWAAVYLYGQRQPVALPLVGSGLARIDELPREELFRAIVESFMAASRTRLVCHELRIVLRPVDLEKISMGTVTGFLRMQSDRATIEPAVPDPRRGEPSADAPH